MLICLHLVRIKLIKENWFLCYKTYGFDLVDIDDSFGSCCGGFGEDTEESSDEE